MSDSTPDWQQEIERIEGLCVEAFVARDIAALRPYFAPALLVNSPLERVNEGAQVLDLLQRGIIAHSSCEATIEHIRRHGDVVVVMGRDRVTDGPEQTISHRRFTNLWRLDGGAWRCFARHANVERREPGA